LSQATENTQQETIDCVITNEEVVFAIKKLKSKKGSWPKWSTSGNNKMLYWQNVWYPECNLQQDVRIKHLSQEWGCGTLTPFYKSRDGNTVGNYKGITYTIQPA